MKLIFPIAHAAELDLGQIGGTGKYQDPSVITRPASTLEAFISTIVGALTAIAGIAFLLYFLLGALTWITAGGDRDKVAKAQKQMTDAAIGLIAVIVAYFIASIIGTILGINILNPAEILFPTTLPYPVRSTGG